MTIINANNYGLLCNDYYRYNCHILLFLSNRSFIIGTLIRYQTIFYSLIFISCNLYKRAVMRRRWEVFFYVTWSHSAFIVRLPSSERCPLRLSFFEIHSDGGGSWMRRRMKYLEKSTRSAIGRLYLLERRSGGKTFVKSEF